ncbi:MAG: hypothetical protein ACJAYC_000718 [Halieaceae bacterium]|jgi:hypothetical protein
MKQILSLSVLVIAAAIASTVLRNPAGAAIDSVVPISERLATSIVSKLFPAALELTTGNLLVTEPEVVFIDRERLALKARFQAYDHRPDQGIAVSEMGWVQISGGLDFDPLTRQILLHNPSIDALNFDRQNAASASFRSDISNNWSAQMTNPMRADIPPHPYVVLIKDTINSVSYDGQNINVQIVYE